MIYLSSEFEFNLLISGVDLFFFRFREWCVYYVAFIKKFMAFILTLYPCVIICICSERQSFREVAIMGVNYTDCALL